MIAIVYILFCQRIVESWSEMKNHNLQDKGQVKDETPPLHGGPALASAKFLETEIFLPVLLLTTSIHILNKQLEPPIQVSEQYSIESTVIPLSNLLTSKYPGDRSQQPHLRKPQPHYHNTGIYSRLPSFRS